MISYILLVIIISLFIICYFASRKLFKNKFDSSVTYFCNFSSDGCNSDKSNGSITVKLLKGGKKVINGHYFKYEPAVSSQVKEPLIISFAYGYRWNKLRVVVTSLRKCGYNGSIIIFIDKEAKDSDIENYFSKYNVTSLLLEDTWPFYSDLNTKYPLDNEMLKKKIIEYRDYSPYDWNVYRFSLIYCFLKIYRHLFSHILHVDCCDVLFQWNPFAWNIQSSLYLVEETDLNYCIGSDRNASLLLKSYRNSTLIYNCRMLNSGSIIGSTYYFYKFIKRFNSFIQYEYIKTSDKVTLNYVFYTQNWSYIPILVNRNGYGFALNLAVDLIYQSNDTFYPHSDMYIYNNDGTKPCLIHHYDREIEKYKEWEYFRSYM